MTKEERIVELALSFPALRLMASGTAEGLHRVGLRPWDAVKLRKRAPMASSSEQQAIWFVLGVWNAYNDKFKLHEALGNWDSENRAAFVAWVSDPWWA